MKLLLTMNLPYTRIFGGANKSNKSLAEEFAKKGHEVIVVAPALATPSHITHEELLEELKEQGIEVTQEEGYYLFESEGVKIYAVINADQLRNKLIQKVNQVNPDWVLISAEDPSQTLLNAAHEVAGNKIIYLAHTPQMFPFGPESMYPGEKRTEVIGKSRLIVTISEFVANYIRENSGFEAFVNHPPHFGEGPYPNLANFDEGYVLTMNPCGVKGIKIFTELAKAYPDIPFAVIPGWGTTPSDRKRMEEIPNITFLKNAPDLNDILKKTKLMLMPTLWSEGFGMATVDAMLRGIPVLASNHGGLTEAKLGTDYLIDVNPITEFKDELDENSLPVAVIPPQDLTPWKKALEQVFYNKEEYEKQSQIAYKRSHEFINTLSVDKLEKWLEEHLPGFEKKKSKVDIKNLTPEQKKKLLLELKKKKQQQEAKNRIVPIEKQDSYELSFAQKRLWILDEINDGYYGYIIPASIEFLGSLNKEALKQAFNEVIGRHESLRTYFRSVDGEPRQFIVDSIDFELGEEDFSESFDPDEVARIYGRKFDKQPFDLSEAPLLRATLTKLGENRHVLFFAMHHIISDGWSMKVLTSEVYEAYLSIDEGRDPELKPLEINYKDYGYWQNKAMNDTTGSKMKDYWYRKLGGELAVLNLPTDHPRPPIKTYNGKIINKSLDKTASQAIIDFCKQHKISVFAYLTTAVKVLLHRYTSQEDIIVGTPTAGRNNRQLENQIGFYVNMLVLRDHVSASNTIEKTLSDINQTILEALEYESYPYDKIVEDLDQNRDLSRSPLFDVMVSLDESESTESSEESVSPKEEELQTRPFNVEEEEAGSSHDLAFLFNQHNKQINVNLVFNTDLFDDWKGEQILNHISFLASHLYKEGNQQVKEVAYMTEQERSSLLPEIASVAWPQNKLVHQIFEEVAEQYPDRIAVRYEEEQLTYRELNEKSNQLAHLLRKEGVERNTIVALLIERNMDMIVSILAVLKAGGTYLPIDPYYPEDRIQYTLNDSKAQFVIASEKYDSLADFDGQMLDLSGLNTLDTPVSNPDQINEREDVAYIIYTSGSTGFPKGVMVMHFNVVRLFFNDDFQFDFNEKDTWTVFHSYCFDFSVWEMYGALLFGGRLIVVPKLIAQSPKAYWELLNKEHVTVLNQTPSAFYNLIEEAKENPVEKSAIRFVIFGGDALNPSKLTYWKENHSHTRLINMYGITETTVHVTFKEITENEIQSGVSNIGKAIPTLKTYILDPNQNLLPLGTPGELCVGGLGLAKGYLNNPELTDKKFIPNPYEESKKLYRSGDLAKLLPSGEMEYLGRIDFQVKIRGFRIELGEIESKLNQYKEIEEVLVIARKDENEENYLCAYYVSREKIEVKDLREHLSKDLPDYMIPSYFIHYKNFPLTSNGKVDRRALLNPLEEGGSTTKRKLVEPRNETERKLQVLWNEALNKKESSVDDNFFEVGGHSLKANVLIGTIYKEFGVEVRLGEFFDAPSIEELAVLVDRKGGTDSDLSIPIVEPQKDYEMSFAQKRMWVLDSLDTTGAYNMPLAYEIKGDLDVDTLEKAFNLVLQKHESLRTNFVMAGDEPRQVINDYSYYPISDEKVDDHGLKKAIEEHFNYRFDLSEDLLIRFRVLNTAAGEHTILVNMHHIISDGWSFGVFFKELFGNYHELQSGNEPEITPLDIQYKDFAHWQNKLIAKYDGHKKYWHDKLSGELPVLKLPYKDVRPKIQTFNGASTGNVLPKNLSENLIDLSKKSGVSLFVVMQTFLKALLYKYTNDRDIILGSPISGRIHPDLENQIGLYVNTLVFRDQISPEDQLQDLLKKVNKTVVDGFDNQAYPFDLLVEELDVNRDLSRNPLFDVMVIMDEEMEDVTQSINDNFSEFEFNPVYRSEVDAKFDLIFSFTRNKENKITVGITYNTDLFDKHFIEELNAHFEILLDKWIQHPEVRVGTLTVLSEKDKEVYKELGNYQFEQQFDRTLIEHFEDTVNKFSERKALVMNGEELTYQQLDNKINQLANYLKEQGIRKGDFVCINLDPSFEYFIAIYAVLKNGGVYVPLDTGYPKSRVEYIVENSSAKFLIGSKILNAGLSSYSSDFDSVDIGKEEPVYCIYTSGSTGMPKGVLVPQRAVLNLCNWFDQEFNVNETDVATKFAGTAFDVSVAEVFPFLLKGASIHIIDKELRKNPEAVNDYFNQNKVNISFLPTQFCELFMEYDNTSLDVLVTGGDVLKKFIKRDYKLYNLYGPTENTVYSTFYPVNDFQNNIPIGKPIANTSAIVVDENEEIVPVNVKGELCLSGDNLAIGYLNNEELTRERFKTMDWDGKRYYKTGDVVRVLEDGNLEFNGRKDFQVKIRGYRIELGEIDVQISNIDGISESITIDFKDATGEKILVNYYVGTPDETEVVSQLNKTLPEYMIPTRFIQLDKMPLNASGKIDRKKLPEPDVAIQLEELVPASTETEKQLVEIWKTALGLPEVGINQNFFQIGGNSLKAVILTNRIQHEFQSGISLSDIFSNPTIELLAKAIDAAGSTQDSGISRVEEKEYYSVSAAQKRLFVLDQFEGIGTTYNMPGALRLHNELNVAKFQKAVNELINRHEGLRTSFEIVDNEPVQKINELQFEVEVEACAKEEVDQKLDEFVQEFDLTKAPLFRLKLLKTGDSHVLLYDIHHIIGDGFSMEIILRDLFALYDGKQLEPLEIQYKDFTEWQNNLATEKQKEYWLSVFEDDIPELNLPYDYPRTGINEFEGGHVSFSINQQQKDKLQEMSLKNGSTLFMTLYSIYAMMLSRLTGKTDLVIGTPVAGRNKKGLEDVVGMFVNNLAIRFNLDDNPNIHNFLKQSKERILEALDNQEYQFEDLVEALEIPRELGKNPIFDTLFTFQTKGLSDNGSDDSLLDFESIGANIKTSKFDLTLASSENDQGIFFVFEYTKGLFKQETIQRMSDMFCRIVEQVVQAGDEKKVGELDILTEWDRELLEQVGKGPVKKWKTDTLVEGFELQAKSFSSNIAVMDDNGSYNYQEVSQLSDRFASGLLSMGVKKGDTVSILMPRSNEAIIAMLGVMKAGACYVPVDLTHPEDRIKYYLTDSHSIFVITEEAIEGLPCPSVPFAKVVSEESDSKSLPELTGGDIAYMIYTSGSTGKPKGVKICHESIVNTIYSQIEKFEITEKDNYLQFASLSFDASITDIYGAFLAGAQLSVPGEKVRKDIDLLTDYCNSNKVTLALIPPSLATLIDEKRFETLRVLVSAGEAANPQTAKRYAKHCSFFNAYGPTEVGVCCTIYKVEETGFSSVPVGKALPNTEVYILDKYGHQVPVGAEGEICVAGVGVAKEYHNRPELSKAKFTKNTHSDYPVLYKTGDLGRVNSDGHLEFIGRIDNQVKIRGFRIELGEVEESLLKLEGIKNVVAIAHGDTGSDRKLVVYVLPSEGSTVDEEQIRTELEKTLPTYMVPDFIIPISEIPLTTNGKINKRLLPKPEIREERNMVEPENHIQQKIWEVWSEVLGTKSFGVTDNFFRIGGNSLLAIKLVSKLSRDFIVKVNQLFENPTIQSLEKVIEYQPDNVKNKLNQLREIIVEEQGQKKGVRKEKVEYLRKAIELYRANDDVSVAPQKDKFKHILITGGVGFLGVYLLENLIKNTSADIYLLIRAATPEKALQRLKDKLEFYFGSTELWEQNADRIHLITGDITEKNLGIEDDSLADKIEAIIHAASKTTHYGEWEEFEKVNVQGVQHVVDFAKKGKQKQVHYVSTLSVASGKLHQPYLFMTESDLNPAPDHNNYYIKSKIMAEQLLSETDGLNGAIYRVGNLMPAHKDGMFQENVDDNAFMNSMKFYLDMRLIPAFKQKIYDFAYIDEMADAIVRLMHSNATEKAPSNIFHLTNSNKLSDVDLGKMISAYWKDFKVEPILKIVDEFREHIDDPKYSRILEEYIANSKVLENTSDGQTQFLVPSERTESLLKQLGFEWKRPDAEYFKKVLQHLEKVGFVKANKEEKSELVK